VYNFALGSTSSEPKKLAQPFCWGWAVFVSRLLLRAGHKSLSAHRAFDTLKVDTAHLGRRNQSSTFGAYRIERCPHFFEIDLPRPWHNPTIVIRDRDGAELQCGSPVCTRSLGLNPPPSAEANLSSRCLSAKKRKFSTSDQRCMFATRRNVPRGVQFRNVNISQWIIGPTFLCWGWAVFAPAGFRVSGMTAYNSRRYQADDSIE
jgi:hypothetical protein